MTLVPDAYLQSPQAPCSVLQSPTPLTLREICRRKGQQQLVHARASAERRKFKCISIPNPESRAKKRSNANQNPGSRREGARAFTVRIELLAAFGAPPSTSSSSPFRPSSSVDGVCRPCVAVASRPMSSVLRGPGDRALTFVGAACSCSASRVERRLRSRRVRPLLYRRRSVGRARRSCACVQQGWCRGPTCEAGASDRRRGTIVSGRTAIVDLAVRASWGRLCSCWTSPPWLSPSSGSSGTSSFS